jgi:hypothetical protein
MNCSSSKLVIRDFLKRLPAKFLCAFGMLAVSLFFRGPFVKAETTFSEYGAFRHFDADEFRPLKEDCNFVSREFGSFEGLLPNKFYEKRDFRRPAWQSFLGTGYKVFSDIELVCDGHVLALANSTSPRPNESTSDVFDWPVFLEDQVDWFIFSDKDTAIFQNTHTGGPKRNIPQNVFNLCSLGTVVERKWRNTLNKPVDPSWRQCTLDGFRVVIRVPKLSSARVRDGKCSFLLWVADAREPRTESDIRLSTKISISGNYCRYDTDRFAVPRTKLFSKFVAAVINSLER